MNEIKINTALSKATIIKSKMLKFKNKYCDEKDDINCNNSNTNIDATLEIIKELNHIKNP